MRSGNGDTSTVDRIALILRRDLKLGADARIDDGMPLAGGEFDLDSLDLLLLITSIEKEFGIKVAEGSIKRDHFATVATLAAFVDSAQAARGV
jgi:acyl carrier protein